MNVPLAQFQKILAEVKEDPVLAFDKPASISQLIDYKITPGKINKSTLIKDMNVTEWTLSNGAKVLYKYLPDARKTIYFVGSAMVVTHWLPQRISPQRKQCSRSLCNLVYTSTAVINSTNGYRIKISNFHSPSMTTPMV